MRCRTDMPAASASTGLGLGVGVEALESLEVASWSVCWYSLSAHCTMDHGHALRNRWLRATASPT